jgi:hypothetical protein
MGNMNRMPDVVVVHKGPRKNSKIYINIFTNVRVDDILNSNQRNPLIPSENEILEIGVGASFEEKYRKKYKL